MKSCSRLRDLIELDVEKRRSVVEGDSSPHPTPVVRTVVVVSGCV